MTTERLSKVKDLTAIRTAPGVGMNIRKMCFTCNKPRSDAGGRWNKRTKMWSCAACVAPIDAEPV